MPYTVWGAFNKFRGDSVDLNSDVSDRARSSRDYLYEQAKRLTIVDYAFPPLAGYIPYGSFARKTKITPLNDIDLLFLLNGKGTASTPSQSNPYGYWLRITDNDSPLAKFRDDHGYVSSIKVLNQIKKSLSAVANYSKADLKRSGEAVVLNLTSYPWVFDIVPAVPIGYGYDNTKTEYYLIPDGSGDWMRTDPRRDTDYVARVSKQHEGLLLPTLRLLKYWNRRTHKPRLSSYHFETLALKLFDGYPKITSFQDAICAFMSSGQYHIEFSCPDPKGLGPNLDRNLDSDTRQKIKAAMKTACDQIGYAKYYESINHHKDAIEYWQKVFGPAFPSYGA